MSRNIRAWARAGLLTALLSILVEIGLYIYSNIRSETYYPLPYTFHTIWEIAALGLALWAMSRLGVSIGTSLSAALVAILILGLSSIFIPDGIIPIQARYWGVESRLTLDTYTSGRFDESVDYDYPLETGTLHSADCPLLLREVEIARGQNEYVNLRGFLSWQAGLASKFNPDPFCIPQYTDILTLKEHIGLFFETGPLILLELSVRVILDFILLMLAQIVYFLFSRQFVW